MSLLGKRPHRPVFVSESSDSENDDEKIQQDLPRGLTYREDVIPAYLASRLRAWIKHSAVYGYMEMTSATKHPTFFATMAFPPVLCELRSVIMQYTLLFDEDDLNQCCILVGKHGEMQESTFSYSDTIVCITLRAPQNVSFTLRAPSTSPYTLHARPNSVYVINDDDVRACPRENDNDQAITVLFRGALAV